MSVPSVGAPALLALALVAAGLAGCARPTGDFGRAAPSVIHDGLMPTAGRIAAADLRGELVSNFNPTDHETTLRDRAWAIVMPIHVRDWFDAGLVEGQRTRLLPEIDGILAVNAYYEYLRRDPFRSSEARYTRIEADMNADAALVGPFWREVEAVREADRFRMAALEGRTDLGGRTGLGARELKDAVARVEENARVVDWSWRALRFRVKAYRHAIERIAVETPSDRVHRLWLSWNRLVQAIAEAELATGSRVGPPSEMVGRPGRRHLTEKDEPVPQK